MADSGTRPLAGAPHLLHGVVLAVLAVTALGWAVLGAVRPADAAPGDPKLERDLTALTNADRTSNGLAALLDDSQLIDVARQRSEDMADRDYFAHEIPPDGHLVFAILDDGAIAYTLAGENIGKLGAATASPNMTQLIEQGFMNSPLHRANILEPQFQEIGIGYSTGNGNQLFTVLFIRPQAGVQAPLTGPPTDPSASPQLSNDTGPVESIVDDVIGRTLDVPGHN